MGPIFWARIWPFSTWYSREIVEIIAKIDFLKKILARNFEFCWEWDPMQFVANDWLYRFCDFKEKITIRFWNIPLWRCGIFYKGILPLGHTGKVGRQVRIPFGEIFLFWCWGGGEAIGSRFCPFGRNRTSTSNSKSKFWKINFFFQIKSQKFQKLFICCWGRR
jgi:hypothetical protein